jgi:hypothetical protein
VFKNPLDSEVTAGATREITVPGIRARYIVRATVEWVNPTVSNGYDIDTPVGFKTWHKKMTVKVTSPSISDSLIYPAVMSYWN